jgi:F-type H+-transporting ATPase subunit alpha
VEILKQAQYSPMTVEKQIAIIYCGTKGLLMKVPIDKIGQFEDDFLAQLELKHKNVLDTLKKGQLNDDVIAKLESVAKELADKYKV